MGEKDLKDFDRMCIGIIADSHGNLDAVTGCAVYTMLEVSHKFVL